MTRAQTEGGGFCVAVRGVSEKVAMTLRVKGGVATVLAGVLTIGAAGCGHDAPPRPQAPVAANQPGPLKPEDAIAPTPGEEKAPSAFAPVERNVEPKEETAAAEQALKAGAYERAITEAKRALSRNERYVPAIVVLAKAYFRLKKFELCAASLDTAAQIDDKNAEIYYMRGQLALQRDEKAEALAAFRAASDRSSNHAAAWNNLSAQYLTAHNFEEAESASRKSLAVVPNSARAHVNLGSALRGLKKYQEAEREYRRAIQADPQFADAYFNLGILYLDADPFPGLETIPRLDQALAQLQRYKQVAGYKLEKGDPVDGYIDEALRAKERERKKQDRLKRDAERAQPKAAAPTQEGGAATPAADAKPAAAKPAAEPKPAAAKPAAAETKPSAAPATAPAAGDKK